VAELIDRIHQVTDLPVSVWPELSRPSKRSHIPQLERIQADANLSNISTKQLIKIENNDEFIQSIAQ